jgi:hypothetical protein
MKNQVKTAMIITGMVLISNILQAQPAANVSVSFQTFYHELKPYGTWMAYADYGNVWMPNAEREFRPYATNGYWAVTEYGNTWVSDYAWGWAPFHYGRWLFDDFYGWLWVPGSEWAPAWVAWRSGGGYYGWAPLAPNVNINYAVNIPDHRWYFVPQQYICGPGLARHFVQQPRVVTIYRHTTVVNHYREEHSHRYYTGPSHHEMQSRSGRRIAVYRVNTSNRPGATFVNNKTVNIYRPSFEQRDERASTNYPVRSDRRALNTNRERTSSDNIMPNRTQQRTSPTRPTETKRAVYVTPRQNQQREIKRLDQPNLQRSEVTKPVQPQQSSRTTDLRQKTNETGIVQQRKSASPENSRLTKSPASQQQVLQTTPERKSIQERGNRSRR